jgi:hypothetical protein
MRDDERRGLGRLFSRRPPAPLPTATRHADREAPDEDDTSEPVPFMVGCPHCGESFAPPDDGPWQRCPRCGRDISADAQQAFQRASQLVSSALEATQMVGRVRLKGRAQREPHERSALFAYQRAHSALETAFQHELPEDLRVEGIALMVEITRYFGTQGMISPVEAGYWTKVLVEQNALTESADLDRRIQESGSGGTLASLARLRWRSRKRQLTRALASLDQQIRELEQIIAFVNPPRARGVRR